MAIKNDSVEQKCYQDYLVAKYVTLAKDNEGTIMPQYNTTDAVISSKPIFMKNGE